MAITAKDLIGIDEVAKIFGKTINHMRNYKNYGIIEPKTKDGNKELYSREEILFAKNLFDENITELKLNQIGRLIQKTFKEKKNK